MIITVITLFPELFEPFLKSSILGRARTDKKITIETLNLRDFGIGRHKTVDDKPYGGGVGMVLKVDVLDAAIEAARRKDTKEAVILLDPKGDTFVQKTAEKFANDYEHLILVCGRYEGYDERVRKLVDFEISVGDYVLSGGEIPAMIVVEAVCRLLPGFLIHEEATDLESFSESVNGRILEHPHYTRPAVYKGESVPEELLTGNASEVNKYRVEEAKKITQMKRPDLIAAKTSTD